ncbi:MAG TPA: type III-B CRISPR-associated protein Cas10/Cmr2 [Deltaproteobacteria bacterium]|nr:type III-B CRISPR-associated protein Cas10/Cmr2 [Deltaproteobacteria bacterium]
MTWQKPDTSYWNNKFAAWWHDPIDKVFSIQKHEERAAAYLQIFGIDRPNDEFWKMADAIAAGFERGQVPSYNADNNKNGAVDFEKNPIITHPTSADKGRLKIVGMDATHDEIHASAVAFLKNHIGMEAGKGDYAAQFEKDPDRFAIARLLYTHLVMRFALAEQNIGGLGALWHRIPADSRFPDHSIWQHNALCSAISSCIELGGSEEDVGLMVLSITPVQGFIATSRKLRDFWVGSVLLSWLAFEGLRWVIENLGADHVLYPSLIDQPLVNAYLEKEWDVSGAFRPKIWQGQPSGIASLPNKFLFLIPFGKAEEISAEIKKAVADKWEKLAQMTRDYLVEKKNMSEEERKYLTGMFTRQTSRYWDFQWAAARLADKDDKAGIENLLDESRWKNQFSYLKAIKPILGNKGYSLKNTSRGILYSTSHSLVQSALAAEKSKRLILREEEPGEKCQMCGEFEVLHTIDGSKGSATEYKDNIKGFWNRFVGDDDFKENEHLCAVCFIKRYAPRVLKKDETHILNGIFRDADSFPSTTMMALTDYFNRNKIAEDRRKEIADKLHDSKTDEVNVNGKEKIKNADKYYAILLMDGDNMGKLVNGETIAATWDKIMHPDIAVRVKEDGFDPLYRDVWYKIFGGAELNKRLVTPAIHAAISEALGDFSIYGVAPIIKRYEGRLVYAGGDDICAFLPIGNALAAAREIKDYYTYVFRFIDMKRKSLPIEKEWKPAPGKLSVNLGIGQDISISAAILICHHKESLTQMIEQAHYLLQTAAKENAERNACAIELRKRHGGSRYFTRKWSEKESWDDFARIGKMAGDKDRELSQSLLYRLEAMRPGIEAIITQDKNAERNLPAFIAKQIEQSGIKSSASKEEIAAAITHIVWDKHDKEKPFNPEGLLISGFLGGEEEND